MANIYLRDMDSYFLKNKVLYARYSDDIIIFAETEKLLSQYQEVISAYLISKVLEINPKKVSYTKPGGTWEFLGVSYTNGKVDLSVASKQKLIDKIRRKSHAIYRYN